jgi:hypothetical protein
MYKVRNPFRPAIAPFSFIPLQCRIVNAFKKIFIDNNYYCNCHDQSHSPPVGLNYVLGFVGAAIGLTIGVTILGNTIDETDKEPTFDGLPDDVSDMVRVPTCPICDDKVMNP